ncbi:acyl-CoA N-acyltransferase [Dimargaris cristalligena]|uniref:Acyl-CoA N-acyltransferase n=1 Tax=Dimargaris cristalligena TaxID=215637 RepID=A0A4V1J543_9FUNG|nr:acyl-CoA N-acyltransferase [Dimargaris cristalligena]|eukprot:RKP37759.1 acyl-CoA N-acyltransferase [Dimargaris cristalligena]
MTVTSVPNPFPGELVVRRIAGPEEFHLCLQVRVQVFVTEQGFPLAIENDAIDQTCQHIIALWRPRAEEECQPTEVMWEPSASTTVPGTPPPPRVGKIGRVAVLQKYRGLRIGQRLMEEAHRVAQTSLGMRKIKIHSQYDKADFYLRIGYDMPDPTQFMEEGYPHVTVVKNLG